LLLKCSVYALLVCLIFWQLVLLFNSIPVFILEKICTTLILDISLEYLDHNLLCWYLLLFLVLTCPSCLPPPGLQQLLQAWSDQAGSCKAELCVPQPPGFQVWHQEEEQAAN
jgi:hypothetical protein